MKEKAFKSNHFVRTAIAILIICFMTLLFVNPIVTYDGWQYISSGKSLFDGTYVSNYFFVRQPLYPIFIGFCLKIYDSLWFVIFMQYVINILCITFFANQIFKDKRVLSISKNPTKTKIIFYVFCWIFLGSFPSYLLAQNLFLPFFLLLALYLFKYDDFVTYEEDNFYIKKNKIKIFLTSFLILSSFLLAKELFVITLISFSIFAFKNKKFRLVNTLSVLLGLSLVIFTSFYINQLTVNAKSSRSYNVTNNLDPFANENLAKNLTASLININPPYTQRIINSFGSLTDVTPTIGWNGLIVDIYKNPNHPMRTFGLNHILQFGQTCNNFPSEGVIAVNKYYLSNGYFKCFKPIIKVPVFIKGIVYLGYLIIWPAFVFLAFSLRKLIFTLGLGTLIYLFIYALIGAGISRYGYPVYPMIILMAIIKLSSYNSKEA